MERVEGLGLADIAAKVDFSTEQVAKMCGVSRRQLAYWAQKGIIPSEESYSLSTVEKVLRIRKELDKGGTLKQAVQRVEARLARRDAANAAVREVAADDAVALCGERIDELEGLLRAVAARVPALGPDDKQGIAAKLPALQLERVVGGDACLLAPEGLMLNLGLLYEHLEAVLEELPQEELAG